MNSYQPNYINQPYNPYGFQNMQQTLNRYQQPEQVYMQNQSTYKQRLGLQGKSVDNIEVVKATDIPLDGSISYFPLVDGSSIVTKQLMQDGTSRMIVYKPVKATPKDNTTENKEIYVTEEQLEEKLKTFNNEEIKLEIQKLKKQIKDLISNSKK